MAAKVMHPQKEIDVERRKWTVGTSLTTLAIAIALAVASIAAAKTISQQNSNVSCTSDEWLWVINQLQNSASAPASITVQLSGGGTIVVAASQVQNKNAHYALDPDDIPAGQTPVGATASIYDSWSGNFVLSHCAGSPSPAPSPTPDRPFCFVPRKLSVGLELNQRRRDAHPALP
jgi:hypothetical protein